MILIFLSVRHTNFWNERPVLNYMTMYCTVYSTLNLLLNNHVAISDDYRRPNQLWRNQKVAIFGLEIRKRRKSSLDLLTMIFLPVFFLYYGSIQSYFFMLVTVSSPVTNIAKNRKHYTICTIHCISKKYINCKRT